MAWFFPAAEGFGLGASLIVAIGAQNAFVLRQGLERRHVLACALFGALADAALILAGVFGLGALFRGQSWFLGLMTWGGTAFLGWYGVRSAYRAWRPQHLDPADAVPPSLGAVLGALAGFTFLNPHVYLDTVVLLGGLGARHPVVERPWFAAGAMLASVVWFFSLAYGARLLAPLFRRPGTWRILDGLIAAVMLGLAASLAASGLAR